MTVKVGGKTYKGKYRGPDQFKGDMTKVRADAAKRRALKGAKSAVSTAAAQPAPAAQQQTAPNPGAVGSNSSGNISLQSNLEIEQQVIDANEQLKQEQERANQIDAQALIQQALGLRSSREGYQEQRGNSNATMAFRGMNQTAAMNRSSTDTENYRKALENVMNAKAASDTEAGNVRTSAQSWRNATEGKLNLQRQAFTNQQSAESPTTGSSPINSGLKATTPAAITQPKATPVGTNTSAAKSVVKKFKGKYPGPDKFKGNKALIAAAKRKAGKK